MLVAANKVDIMEDPPCWTSCGPMWRKGLELFEMSAAAHQGTQELIKRCAQELAQLPPVVVYEPTYVERPPRWIPKERSISRSLTAPGWWTPLAPAAYRQRQFLRL